MRGSRPSGTAQKREDPETSNLTLEDLEKLIPRHVDWRSKNIITPVKDQAQ